MPGMFFLVSRRLNLENLDMTEENNERGRLLFNITHES